MTPREINKAQLDILAEIENIKKEYFNDNLIEEACERPQIPITPYLNRIKILEDRYSELKSLEQQKIKVGDTNEGEERGNNRES